MAKLRRNEWNFSGNAAAMISAVLQQEQYRDSPLGHAEPELTELKGAKRLDLVLFQRDRDSEPIVTGELKVPWTAEGRTPYNSSVVRDAHSKASSCGAQYFLTWNIRRVVVWKTDDPGVELDLRVVYDDELVARPLRNQESLSSAQVVHSIQEGIARLVSFLHSRLTGSVAPTYLPLDQLFIARLEAMLNHPIECAIEALRDRCSGDRSFKAQFERWMREKQGWLISESLAEENTERAARLTTYILVNKLCFHNALRRKYVNLPRIAVANSIKTGAQLKKRLERSFEEARTYTGDYETVFNGDWGDQCPFVADEAVPEWRKLIRSLDDYDFANLGIEIIGAMYERLIEPKERHRYGQHYTQPAVVDLINTFAMRHGNEKLLDPSCGGGTFLVRAYQRARTLRPDAEHAELLEQLYGCDIQQYACHLSTINLAVRDLIDDDNFPRIHQGDFLDLAEGDDFVRQPVRMQAGGLPTGETLVTIHDESFDAIVGNPPYIQSREIPAKERAQYTGQAEGLWPAYDWAKDSDIYVHFWTHSTRFLKKDGTLALLTQAGWLDVEYGIPLQQWMLDKFVIVAILETEAEPWFTDARVATVVGILRREGNKQIRAANQVRFVEFRRRLNELAPPGPNESAHQAAAVSLRDRILAHNEDDSGSDYRIRLVSQADLLDEGTNAENHYIGSKWGRYLRSTDTLYGLQAARRSSFVRLDLLAHVRRGITTNCDSFFLVRDISKEALAKAASAGAFQSEYGVTLKSVTDGTVKIIKRSDGFECALQSTQLRPIVKSARGLHALSTSALTGRDYAVYIPEKRTALGRMAKSYVRAGEREKWHKSPSFENAQHSGREWFTLREATHAPILFVKTMQYAPFVLLNDAECLANQRLYNVTPSDGVDVGALCAVLNSTVFAAERYAAVKALGREAAIDVEVFTARSFRTPDVRSMSPRIVADLGHAMTELAGREVGSLLEDGLANAGLSEARLYVSNNPVREDIWPAELKCLIRQRIDELILEGLGVKKKDMPSLRVALYNDLLTHVRKLRLLELEAQMNRRGSSGGAASVSVARLADEIWARLIDEAECPPVSIPSQFIDEGTEVEVVHVPTSRTVKTNSTDLFDEPETYACTIGRKRLEFDAESKRDLIVSLASVGVDGDIAIPVDPDSCKETLTRTNEYLRDLNSYGTQMVAEVSGEYEFRERLMKEVLKRVSK